MSKKMRWWSFLFQEKTSPPTDVEQARALIAAIDAGGIPLNPVRVNAIARNLGLEVSRRARVEETVARFRACISR